MELFAENSEFVELAKRSGYVDGSGRRFPEMEYVLLGCLFSVWPRFALEYGTFLGWSTCLIAWAMKTMGGDRKLYSVDKESQDEAARWVGFFEVSDFVKFHRSVTWEFRHPEIRYDFVLLDASHDYLGWKKEWESIQPRIHDKTLILVHDTIADPNWDRLAFELEDFNPFLLPLSGITLLRRDSKFQVDRDWVAKARGLS